MRAANTPAAVSVAAPGAVDRFDKCPVGLASGLITAMGASALTLSRHRPAPSPSPPLTPAPDSSCAAPSVRAAPAPRVRVTAPGEVTPASSMPSMRTSAGLAPGLTMRSRLSWLVSLAGLNTRTRCTPPTRGTTSCTLLTNPSCACT